MKAVEQRLDRLERASSRGRKVYVVCETLADADWAIDEPFPKGVPTGIDVTVIATGVSRAAEQSHDRDS